MMSSKIKRDPFWILQRLETYSHLLLKIKFRRIIQTSESIKFKIELFVQGFEGLLFYFYMNKLNSIKFDLLNQQNKKKHDIENLIFESDNVSNDVLDFIIIPFGHFKEENKITILVISDDYQTEFNLFSWTPSYLYKHFKSIIKIRNEYVKIVPKWSLQHGSFFKLKTGFKANESSLLFELINLISEMDEFCGASDIKDLISKANEYLFEISENHLINIIKELKRLKNNIAELSKEEIIKWINDIILFYSNKA